METRERYSFPDERGYFGAYGGRFVPETLVPALDDLKKLYDGAKIDPEFQTEFSNALDVRRATDAADLCGSIDGPL